MSLTSKQRVVLEELRWLCDDAPAWARQANDGYWRAFHVRYFRAKDPARDPALRGMSVEAVGPHLSRLAQLGLAVQHSPGRALFRITDTGREALGG